MLYALLSLPLDILGQLNNLGNPYKISNIGGFVSSAIGMGITLAAIACLFYLLWGGFDWLLSGGDKGALENARNKITAAIVGLIIVVSVWAIFLLLQYFLGLNVAQRGGSGGGGGGGGGGQVQDSGGGSGGLKCPGPNCDRCEKWPTRRSDWVPSGSSQWQINEGCP